MRLLLASKSPRRRQLLAAMDVPVAFVDVDVDEHLDADVDASAKAELLARKKSMAYDVTQMSDGDVLVTADTVVVHDGVAMGKPGTRGEAMAMLHDLSGRKHTVYTGVCLRSADHMVSFTEATDVHFRSLGDDEIAYYVDHYRPYDKAGSYGIQEWIGMVGIERIEGCYYNVMGLPVARLYETLMKRFSSR
mgnify:CR=1 FL=1